MNLTSWLILYVLAAIGHMAIWVALFNQLHATNLNNRWIRRMSYPLIAIGILCLPFVLVAYQRSVDPVAKVTPEDFWDLKGIFGGYVCFCLASFLYTAIVWTARKTNQVFDSRSLIHHQTEFKDFSAVAQLAERSKLERFFAALPGNQIYACAVEKREILLEKIAPSFDGLSITHLSDLHFTGKICREYFEAVIATANDLDSDMIVITGDVIDSKDCWPWLEQVLGQLHAPLGVYYILGNHDQRVHCESELRAALDGLGFTGVADRWEELPVKNHRLHIAGNELPWFGAAKKLAPHPDNFADGDMRLLLSHSPDQWQWGRSLGFELTLAGHTHGGQIQIPLIGPVIAPSKYGVKYASGMFEREQQVLIVSRGVSGEEPVRFNCPPEVGKITVRTSR